MPTAILIPARYGSSRFPGKMLTPILGYPAICWPFQAASELETYCKVVTDDQRIADAVGAANALIVATETRNGTERCALALDQVPPEYDTICIVAGDQTTITPVQIARLIEAAQAGGIWTAICPRGEDAVTTCEVIGGIVQAFDRGQAFEYAALGVYVYPRAVLAAYLHWCPPDRETRTGIEIYRSCIRAVNFADASGIDLNYPDDVGKIEAWLR